MTPPGVVGAPEWLEGVIQRVGDRLCECLLKGMETFMLTSRGAKVRAPETCAQPVSGKDLDEVVRGLDVPSVVGDRVTVLEIKCDQAFVIKAVGWQYALDPSVKIPIDPSDQLKVDILVDGKSVGWTPQRAADAPTDGIRSTGAWLGVPGTVSGGIDGLTAAHIYVRADQVARLVVERIASISGAALVEYKISARLKGWAWIPSINADGATGAGGF